MRNRCVWAYSTPWGEIVIECVDQMIEKVYLPGCSVPETSRWEETSILQQAGQQLREYLNLQRMEFLLPIHPHGTPFMKQVWECLRKIPYGETITYKQIAEDLNRTFAYRAVGMANARNPLAIFIPCHRVLGTDGSLTGFGGGLKMKQGLLDLEQKGIFQKLF